MNKVWKLGVIGMLAIGMVLSGCISAEDFELEAEDCTADELYIEEEGDCYLPCELDGTCEVNDDDLIDVVVDFLDDGEGYGLEASDCYDDETYVEDDQMCYLTCELDGTCDADVDLFSFFGSFLADIGDIVFGVPEDANVLITYVIEDDRPIDPIEGDPFSDEESEILENRAAHQEMWREFAALIPAEHRRQITQYAIFTDGVDNTMAYVEPIPGNETEWRIALDAIDAKNKKEQQYTLIHEFAHILTLNNEQVPFDEDANQDDAAYEEAAQACSTFFTGEGCANRNAYISLFFEEFWGDIYNELPDYDDEDGIYQFYETYQDRFVSDYAATNPGEDIAESWTHFVINDRPSGNSIADQKVRFFYEFPELVRLRDQIRARVYSESRRN